MSYIPPPMSEESASHPQSHHHFRVIYTHPNYILPHPCAHVARLHHKLHAHQSHIASEKSLRRKPDRRQYSRYLDGKASPSWW